MRVNNYADLFFHDRYDYASCENVDDCIVLLYRWETLPTHNKIKYKANWFFPPKFLSKLKNIIIIGKNFKYLSNYKLLLNI